MERVLITGASGVLGINTIKYLLSEGHYEITALDLKNKKSINRLKTYSKRINVIYGDTADRTLMEYLVKDQDYIIYLASIMPPMADLKKNLSNIGEYQPLENTIRAINYYNPECKFIYASSTSIYGNSKTLVNVNTDPKIKYDEYFSQTKLKCEQRIQNKLHNYLILRVPLVLSKITKDPFMFNIEESATIETITDIDAAYAITKCLPNFSKLNKQIYNLGGGERFIFKCQNLFNSIFKINGYSFRYFFINHFIDKNYYSPVTSDSDILNKIIDYRDDTFENYLDRLSTVSRKRKLAKLIYKIMNKNRKGDN
jgi:nucleoside-diphosphate-sugar epimerase